MKQGFLQTDNGNFSSARLMFIVGLCYAMVVTVLGFFFLGWSPGEGIAFLTSISAVYVGLKLGQKPMENNNNNIKTE